MKRAIWMGALVVAALSLALTARATVFEVKIIDYSYVPDSLTIMAGDSVHWTNDGTMPHTVTRGSNCTSEGDFDSGELLPGQSWGYAFDETDKGTHEYFCQYHCASLGMKGWLTVDVATPVKESSWGQIKSVYR